MHEIQGFYLIRNFEPYYFNSIRPTSQGIALRAFEAGRIKGAEQPWLLRSPCARRKPRAMPASCENRPPLRKLTGYDSRAPCPPKINFELRGRGDEGDLTMATCRPGVSFADTWSETVSRHRLNGYLARRVPSLFLASGFRVRLKCEVLKGMFP